MSDERKISARYRELPREEPPRAVDDAILAASRRAVRARPAPLVAPSGRSRWYFPVAAAAIIVLAVAVTVHVERERPDAEIMSGPVTMPEGKEQERKEQERKEVAVAKQAAAPKPPAPAAARKAAPQVFAPDPKPAVGGASPSRDNALDAARAKAIAESERREATAAAQGARRADETPGKASAVLAKVAEQSPEQLLQGIADLRRQRRHDEADKALAEFRKRFPDYKISEAMLERVERSRAR